MSPVKNKPTTNQAFVFNQVMMDVVDMHKKLSDTQAFHDWSSIGSRTWVAICLQIWTIPICISHLIHMVLHAIIYLYGPQQHLDNYQAKCCHAIEFDILENLIFMSIQVSWFMEPNLILAQHSLTITICTLDCDIHQ